MTDSHSQGHACMYSSALAVCRCKLYLFIKVTILFVSPFAAHSCTRVPLIVCRFLCSKDQIHCFLRQLAPVWWLCRASVPPFAAHSCTRVPLIVCCWISKFNAFRNSNALSDGARPYIYIYIILCVCVYIYIYRERERERDRYSISEWSIRSTSKSR